MKDRNLENYYNCVTGMINAPHTDVTEGRHVVWPVNESVTMEIDPKET